MNNYASALICVQFLFIFVRQNIVNFKAYVMKTKVLSILPLLLLFLITSCNEDSFSGESSDLYRRAENPNKPGDKTIFELADGLVLIDAIRYVDSELNAGLEDAIKSNEVQLTVFAPTDQAFLDLLAFLSDARGESVGLTDIPAPIVLAVLQYHITEGRRASNSVVPKSRNNKEIETLLEGATFEVDMMARIFDNAYVDLEATAQIGPADLSASNGVVHIIDKVILPLRPSEVLALWDSLESAN